MAKISGRKLRVVYSATAIAGALTDSITINREPIDITDKDDVGVRAYLSELGSFSMSMSCEGRLDGDVLAALARDSATALHTFTFDIDGIGAYSGSWCVTSFEVSGADPDGATFTASFESSGAITWTPDA
jgi:predicted secreted protein